MEVAGRGGGIPYRERWPRMVLGEETELQNLRNNAKIAWMTHIQPNLKLKTQPRQLLSYLLLAL